MSKDEDKKVKRRKKRFCIHRKAFTAVLLSLVLAFASVSSIQTQAEEAGVEVPPAAEEEPPADEGVPGGEDGAEENETENEPAWVKTPEGAVILTAFVSLSEVESVITSEERESLAELTARMPKTLKAYAGVYVTESPDEDQNPGDEDKKPEEGEKEPGDEDKKPEEGEKEPGDEDKKPEEGEKEPGDEDKKPEEGEKEPGDEDKNPEEGEKEPGDEDKKPEEGEKEPGDEDKNPEEGEKEPGDEDKKPEEGEKEPGDEDKNPEDGNENSAGSEARWHLFVASETKDTAEDGVENIDATKNPEDENKNPEDETKNPEDENKNPEDENKNPEDGDKTPEDDGQQPSEEPAIQPVEVEIPVTWECAGYESEERQGEQEEQKEEQYEYVFTPKWDSTLWFYDMTAEGAMLPTITVRYEKEEAKAEVSTQEELAAAFAAGLDKVVLKADIALTMTIMLPATAKIELDGEGHSLLRGTGEDGAFFAGTMIAMEGEDYTEETFGTLTLKSIAVDGRTETDGAVAPAILDRGELILEEDAVVQSNCNYGTYPAEGEEGAGTVLAYGGGIQVYGRLTLTENASVMQNFANELGGGVYLADGAALWLYADVIRENAVSADGYGDDLYAAAGSTIYYDPSIDMTRDGFYLCEGVTLIPMGEMALMANSASANGKEIFLHVAKDSGYTNEQVEAIKAALREKGYTVLTDRRVEIDTTDLRDWYVYDHYDTALWPKKSEESTEYPPASWVAAYPDREKRNYYPWTETAHKQTGFTDGKGLAKTIQEWLERKAQYNNGRTLAQFEEHIWSRKEGGKAAMTFAGYGQPAYVDFLFYDPQSDGEKVVNFDVDSSMVTAHTLAGAGCLLNTKIEGDKLTGYVVIYEYIEDGPSTPHALSLYYLNDVSVTDMHNLRYGSYFQGLTPVKTVTITASEWNPQMCVQIKATPTKIEVRQTPKTDGVSDASQGTVKLTCDNITDKITATGGSAFGPLVSYFSHGCNQASSFTYSNLSMYFTDAQEEQSDVMQPFERADFTQRDTQRYFVNLLGKSDAGYNDDVNLGQYREYLKLLQEEGVALVTDRDTPFDDYLGKANEPDSNLVELSHDGGLLSVEELVEKIHEQLKDKTTTEIAGKVGKPADEGGVQAPEVHHSAGNIWLKSVTDGSQVRKLYGDAFSESGYAVQIMDDITYYHGSRDEVSPVAYEVLKPGASGYVSVASSRGGDVTPNSMGETDDGIMITPSPFVVEKNKETWPAGVYVVKQTITNGSICGYAFFDMVWGEQPPVLPDTPIPDPPEPEPDPTPNPPPAPGPDPEPGTPLQESPAEYTEETVTITAAEPMSPDAEPAQEPEKKPGEPKTGDMPIAALPVSMGACTAFVMKLRLWLYELEAGISEEKKNAIIRSIIAWAKNKSMVKVYLALAATAVVATAFHLLKMVCGGRRRVVELIDR